MITINSNKFKKTNRKLEVIEEKIKNSPVIDSILRYTPIAAEIKTITVMASSIYQKYTVMMIENISYWIHRAQVCSFTSDGEYDIENIMYMLSTRKPDYNIKRITVRLIDYRVV